MSSIRNIIEVFGKTLKDMSAPEETNEEEVATSGKAAEEEQGMLCVF